MGKSLIIANKVFEVECASCQDASQASMHSPTCQFEWNIKDYRCITGAIRLDLIVIVHILTDQSSSVLYWQTDFEVAY